MKHSEKFAEIMLASVKAHNGDVETSASVLAHTVYNDRDLAIWALAQFCRDRIMKIERVEKAAVREAEALGPLPTNVVAVTPRAAALRAAAVQRGRMEVGAARVGKMLNHVWGHYLSMTFLGIRLGDMTLPMVEKVAAEYQATGETKLSDAAFLRTVAAKLKREGDDAATVAAVWSEDELAAVRSAKAA